jgi:hypothetical protein
MAQEGSISKVHNSTSNVGKRKEIIYEPKGIKPGRTGETTRKEREEGEGPW